jgi:16S rRNA (guanine966-N2)-methyltransferase
MLGPDRAFVPVGVSVHFVTRIVGGSARGRRLAVPPRGTRPTAERAREAMFNTLATELDWSGSRMLDLYAGSGAVGLEALSRGACEVVFVEGDHGAAAILSENIAAVRLAGAVIHRCPVETYLAALGADQAFDVIFADPPYSTPPAVIDGLLQTVNDESWLTSGGIVVVERSWRDAGPSWPNEMRAIKQRRYGEGSLWYGRRE